MLQRDLDHILLPEEIHWHQKYKSMWIIDDDRNTRYYDIKTVARRKRSKIEMIKNSEGVWIEDCEEIKKTLVDFFINLFADDGLLGD